MTVLVSEGTASWGQDYSVFGASSVSFGPGETSKTVPVIRVLIDKPADSRTVNLKLVKPTGDVALGSPSSAILTIQGTESAASSGAISKFDPACGRGWWGIGCSGNYLRSDGLLKSDLAELERADVPRNGVVTDGVTLLLLRVRSSTPVTFSLRLANASAGPAYGTLMQRDGSHAAGSVTVTPETTSGGPTAFALYQAPPDFPLPTDAEVSLNLVATNAGGSTTTSLILKRPPVVLVHGVWSSQDAFLQLSNYLRQNGFDHVVRADYSQDAAGSFDPRGDSIPIDALETAVYRAVKLARADGDGIAASQVDVVAHSMGGLVARARERDPGRFTAYKRAENRFRGEFHKLITIGTPHQGTPVADWFIDHRCDTVGIAVGLKKDVPSDYTQRDFFEHMDLPIGPAVYGFQTASPILERLGSTSVRTHAIAGREPTSKESETEHLLNSLIDWSGHFFASVDSILNGNGNHDTIVPLASQRGGLTTDVTATIFDGVVHANLVDSESAIAETMAREEPHDIFSRVVKLLRDSTTSSGFGFIAPYKATGMLRYDVPCPPSVVSPELRKALADAITLAPSPGTVVRPGESIQVTFSAPSGSVSNSAVISIRGKGTLVAGSGGTFSFTYQVPVDIAGQVEIFASTLGAASNYAASTYVVVLPNAPPDNLTASPGTVALALSGATAQLRITGNYQNGSTIDLTSAAIGTTYVTESGTNSVVSVSAEGVVQARGTGQDIIVVHNGSQIASVTAVVNITNQRPSLAALADATAVTGQALDIALVSTDPDGNSLELSGINLPAFATLVDNHNGTGVIRVRLGAADVGSYAIGAAVTDDGVPPLGASQTFQLKVAAATISVSPSSLHFAATKTATASTLTNMTAPQDVTVAFSSAASAWAASADQTWVQITNGSGSANGTFTVSIVNPSNVIGASTSLSATIMVTAASASNSPITIPVTLTVRQPGTTAAPFGAFDTPANNAAGVVGAIPVTGWALDDIGVDRVEIWRNCVEAIDRPAGACFAATPGGAANFVFIGRAAFLAGARPDVEAIHPSLPSASRAGWGYLMLTNALPHLASLTREGGQGAFTLSAYAVDIEGHYTLLGTKTITLDNDHATIPFGAIDTPDQGGTVPGSTAGYNDANAYPNFGWAMTQVGKCIDTSSTGSYRVYIDGVVRTLTPGSNWFPGLNRPDIAAAYPGHCNTTNALAAYYINADALGLANGLHTIGWDAIDNQGHVAGIGSRFFIVVR